MLYKKFKIIAGVRRDGVILYSINMNVLIKHLESTKFRCVINGVYFGCFFCMLMILCCSALQSIRNFCESFAEAIDKI